MVAACLRLAEPHEQKTDEHGTVGCRILREVLQGVLRIIEEVEPAHREHDTGRQRCDQTLASLRAAAAVAVSSNEDSKR